MKIILTIFLLIVIGCKAQTPILPLAAHYSTNTPGAYYKDLNNDLDPFVGTWKVIYESTSLEIKIEKKTMIYNSFSNLYEDLLVGEYKYVQHGVLKVNTLVSLASPPSDLYLHNIVGNLILAHDNFPVCSDCLAEKRVFLMFSDPTHLEFNGLMGRIELRRVDEGNVEKIKVTLRQTGNIITVNDEPQAYTSFSVPFGTYILTRIP